MSNVCFPCSLPVHWNRIGSIEHPLFTCGVFIDRQAMQDYTFERMVFSRFPFFLAWRDFYNKVFADETKWIYTWKRTVVMKSIDEEGSWKRGCGWLNINFISSISCFLGFSFSSAINIYSFSIGSLSKNDFVKVSSSNVNEVIRAVVNFFFFFYKKILHAQKAQKAPKAQRRNQAKAQKRK